MGTNWNFFAPTTKSLGFMKGQPDTRNCVAYCHFIGHKGGLSKDMLRKHECLRKGCKYLEKYTDHPYWAKREEIKKLRKESAPKNTQGVSGKNRTGSNVRTKTSTLNTDFKGLLSSFDNLAVYHAYIFYKEDFSKLRYAGGFYDVGTAVSKAKIISDEEGGDYIVIANGLDAPTGFRLEPTSRVPIEIDLTWSELYSSLSERVSKEVSLRLVYRVD